jgi:hypothetical protein
MNQDQAMQQQMNSMPMMMGFSSMTSRKNEVLGALKELVNADEIVDNVRFQLSGKKYITMLVDGQEKRVEKKYHEPLMNDLGVSSCISDFRSFINSNMILSFYEPEDIQKWSYVYYTNVIFDLARNMRNYEVMTRENHAKVRMILHSNFRSVMGRALRGMTLLTALKNIDVHEVRDFNQQDPKPGILSMFGRR